MNNKETFLRMFRYDHWAHHEWLDALRASPSPLPGALRFVGHNLAAEKLWLERLERVPQSMPVWPNPTVEQCSTLADEMLSKWETYLAQLPPDDFTKVIDYRNSKGEPWSSRVDDILVHVLVHSAYHRGQAALEMRAAGFQPPNTDFIHGVRQGLVD
ncbi:MAG TPA: DinB family protein [Terriglobales bacterium]|nr:DinB family protein [Terriglobales bacterium]